MKATESTGLQLGLDSYRAPWKIICIRTAFKEYKAYGADLYKEALTMLAKAGRVTPIPSAPASCRAWFALWLCIRASMTRSVW